MSSVVKKHRNQQVMTTFAVVERRIPNPHKVQFYLDYGVSNAGPWVKIGLNDTELGVGYLPMRHPAKAKVTPIKPIALPTE